LGLATGGKEDATAYKQEDRFHKGGINDHVKNITKLESLIIG